MSSFESHRTPELIRRSDPDTLQRVTVTPFPGHEGMGSLLSTFLTQLTSEKGRLRTADTSRLGTVLIDLLTAVLAHHLDDVSIPPESRQRALLLQIHAFIQQNLSDPRLSAGTVAAAHHISVRTLHRLFQTQDTSVTRWIRARRLDRCQRDLTDPLLRDRPIHVIAKRWGFSDHAHFTRVFRAAYGLSPRDYRHQRRDHGPPGTP